MGSGWSIPSSYIQRDIEYSRADTDNDTFDLYLNGAKHDLVYVAAEGRYHTKVESFLKIEKEGDTYWTVTDKSGTRYRFGYPDHARHEINTSDAAASGTYTWRWSLDQVMDANGNGIYYTYSETPANGETYLSTIEYNTEKKRGITFITEERPDQYWVVEQGSEILQTRRLKEIQIHVDGVLARKYLLAYTLNEPQTKSLLTAITLYGSDGTTTLPPITFDYKPLDKAFDSRMNWAHDTDRYIRQSEEDGDQYYGTFDITGDGLPDYVKYLSDDYKFLVWKNTGTGFNPSESEWQLIPSRSSIRYIRDVREEEGKATNTRSAFMDFNRDGRVELIRAGGETDRKMLCAKTNGTGFDDTTEFTMPMTAWVRNTVKVEIDDNGDPENAPNVEQSIMDLNGDGLPDIVTRTKLDSDNFNAWRIFWNNGQGFDGNADTWRVSHSEAWIEDFERDDRDVEVTTADMNGDGLVDIIRSMGKEEWRVYMNTGSHFRLLDTNWAPPGLNDDDIIDIIDHDDPDKANDSKRTLIDINGDGLPDVVEASDSNSGYWDVYFNKGNGFTGHVDWNSHINSDAVQDNTVDDLDRNKTRRDMIDMNGDGVPDIANRPNDTNPYWDVYLNRSGTADLLTGITDMLGGTVAVDYTSSMNYANTRLPFNFWVVDAIITDNGMSGAHHREAESRFSYTGGLYDFPTREFRGFAEVRETRANNSNVIHRFHQDESRKGKEYQTDFQDSTSRPFARTEIAWSGTSGPGYFTILLDQERKLTFDGRLENPREIRSDFVNYDVYGNLLKQIEYGDTAVTGDERYTDREFEYNTTAGIVDRMTRQTIRDAENGDILRESWFGYDDQGNLTLQEKFLDTGPNPITTHGYDTYGNRIQTTDPEGRVMRTEYDTTFHTFPAKLYNPKNQLTTREYNAITGEVSRQTDPNGFVTRFVFDTFSRKIKEIHPYDTETLPTVETLYAIDGAPPEQVSIKRREISGEAGTLDTHQIMDGFGNLIQTRKESEDPAHRIVADTFYDAMGRVERQSNPYLGDGGTNYSLPDTTAPATVYDYDAMGRPVRITHPDGEKITRVFDHWTVSETDENGHLTDYHFNAEQKLLTVIEHNQGDDYTTRYQYLPTGQLNQITDHPGNITRIYYDTLGRKIRMDDPDMGTWLYGYDMAGNLTAQTDARGITTGISYDPLNRKETVDYPSDTDIQYIYDRETIGTLSEITEPWGSSRYLYDERKRKVQEDKTIDGNTWTTQWQYDALNRMTRQIFPDGESAAFTYNPQGHLESISGILTSLDYNAADRQIRKTYANGIVTDYTFEPARHRLTSMFADGIQDYQYTYDPAGNILSIKDGITRLNETFTYDDLDRLTSASDAEYSATYSYNAIGNMLQETMDTNVIAYTYGENGAGPHAVTGVSGLLPVVGTFVINNGNAETSSNFVSLTLATSGDPTHYMASEDPNFTGEPWLSHVENPSFLLSAGFGKKNLYFKVKNPAGESTVKSDTILFNLDPEDENRDNDGDGLTNKQEYEYGTNPDKADSDDDGWNDYEEIIEHQTDPLCADTDTDGLDDPLDPYPGTPYHFSSSDSFNSLPGQFNEGGNARQPVSGGAFHLINDTIAGLSGHLVIHKDDYDNDGMPNEWEVRHGLNPLDRSDAGQDLDGDHLTNLEEYNSNTHPRITDTDNDGLDDYMEVKITYSDPNNRDTDQDGLADGRDPAPLSNLHGGVSENYATAIHHFNEGGELRSSSLFATSDAIGNAFSGPLIYSSAPGCTPVQNPAYTMVQYGIAHVEGSAAPADSWICAFGPGGENDCRDVCRIGTDGAYFLTIGSNTDGDTLAFKLISSQGGTARYALERIVFQDDGTEVKDLHFTPLTPGDLNHDGEVDLVDLILSLRISCGILLQEIIFNQAEMDGSGKIGIEEAIGITQSIVRP